MIAYLKVYIRFFLLSVLFGWALSTPTWHTASDGKRYLVESGVKNNWLQAYDQCARRGLQLVEVENDQQNAALLELLRKIFGTPPDLYLGYQDEFNQEKNTKRPFYSLSNGEQITFSNWYPGEPNNANGNEHCVEMRSIVNMKWNDAPCEWIFDSYICEEHYLTTRFIEDLEQKRKTAYKLNSQLVDEFVNENTQLSQISEETKKDTLLILSELRQSLLDMRTNLRISINAIIAEKPYLEAVISDVGESFEKLIAETCDEVSTVSNDAWGSIKDKIFNAEVSVNEILSDLKVKLDTNTNEIDNLLVH